jgi:hypothetical protein
MAPGEELVDEADEEHFGSVRTRGNDGDVDGDDAIRYGKDDPASGTRYGSERNR